MNDKLFQRVLILLLCFVCAACMVIAQHLSQVQDQITRVDTKLHDIETSMNEAIEHKIWYMMSGRPFMGTSLEYLEYQDAEISDEKEKQ